MLQNDVLHGAKTLPSIFTKLDHYQQTHTLTNRHEYNQSGN